MDGAGERMIGALCAVIRGDAVAWTALQTAADEFLRVAIEEGVAGLVYARVRALPPSCAWPTGVTDRLARHVHAQTAVELLREAELRRVLQALASGPDTPLIVKGTALAYSVYDAPASRPRVDTDLLIRADQLPLVRRTLEDLGYAAPPFADGHLLFRQVAMTKHAGPVSHTLDIHTGISTQPVFADVLTFDGAARRAVPLPALGPGARTLSAGDALLLACVHPAMHHRNASPLVWRYDVHLLALSMRGQDLDAFAAAALDARVASICLRQLHAARAAFGTDLPDAVLRRLAAAAAEPSAVYLEPGRGWIDEVLASLRALPRWRDRLGYLRAVLFPSPSYMFAAYGIEPSGPNVVRLPVLYVRRLWTGGVRIAAGEK